MEPPSNLVWFAFAVALLAAMIAAAAEAALFYMNRARLRYLLDHGTPRAQAILNILENPLAAHTTVTALSTLAVGAAGALALLLVSSYAQGSPLRLGVGLAVAAFVLLFTDLLARGIAVRRAEAMGVFLQPPLAVAGLLLQPLVWPISTVLDRALRFLGQPLPPAVAASTEEELRMLVDVVDENRALEEDEREMIHGIFELSERTVREVMVPRIDIVAVESGSLLKDVIDRILASGHSRIPIYRETIDDVVGVLYLKDTIKHLAAGQTDVPVDALMRQIYVVPETKKVDELLHEMQKQRIHIALVVDEYGGTAGLVTIEDVLEEIVGEIQDEYDREESRVERVSENEAILDARVSIRDLNEILDLELSDEEFDTLGGLVYGRLGKVPVPGDSVQEDGATFTVLDTHGKRIRKVRVVVNRPAPTVG